MDKAIQSIPTHAVEDIVLKIGGEYRNIAISDLVYCESANNHQRLFLKNGEELLVRMTLQELYETLESCDCFHRCGRAYILNLNHINKVTPKTVLLKNGSVLPIPRSTIAALRTAFFNYFNACGGNGL